MGAGRTGRSGVPPEVKAAFTAFARVVDVVGDAKDRLVDAAPRGRSAPVPLAEALWAFEEGIGEAKKLMPTWRTPVLEDDWQRCSSALADSAHAAEELRLGPPPDGYEALYARLAELLEPLDTFVEAARAFRSSPRS